MTINTTYGAPHPHQHAKVTIDSSHANTHAGWMSRVFQKNADGAPVADDAVQSFVVDLSATEVGENLHVVISASSGGDAELQVWEDITYESGDTVTAYNMHRASSHTAAGGTVVIKKGATITTSGKTQLDGAWIPGGKGPNSAGGASRGGEEWIFKATKKYAVILVNRAGSAKDMSLTLTYYED
jgi:hypothetical protein